MTRYIAQRILGMLLVMFIVTSIVFVILRVTPGDPAAVMLGPEATQQDIEALRIRMGLDRPLAIQYVTYLGEIASGDLGQSIFLNQPVVSALVERTEPTLCLTLMSIFIATAIALPVGIYAAYRRGSAIDQFATAFTMLAASVPGFWLSLLLMQFFAVHLGWFPVSGYGGPGTTFLERMNCLVLPAVALGLVSSALIMRFTRASMLDVLSEDFVKTARAKGLSERKVVLKHALKNALIPILTIIGMTFAALISGAVVTETVFSLPGVGNLVVSAVLRRDYPVIQGALLTIAAIYVLINFLIDMLYLLIDPRVKY